MITATVASKLKIVSFGSINGDLEQLTQKMSSIQSSKAGPFDLFLIVGDLFSTDQSLNEELGESLLQNTFKFPVPTYFIIGSIPLPGSLANKFSRGGDICENLTYLGKAGVLKTASGAKLAYLSGHGLQTASSDEKYSEQDVQPLLEDSAATNIDILLTHDWPDSVHYNSPKWKVQLDAKVPSSSKLISRIAAKLQPKYHFAAPSQGVFFEREPFKTVCVQEGFPSDQSRFNVTRFISLGSIEAKQRWVYAMNLAQGTLPFHESELPPKTTATPYRISSKPALPEQTPPVTVAMPQKPAEETFYQPLAIDRRPEKRPYQDGQSQDSNPRKLRPGYVCRICQGTDHYITDCPSKTTRQKGLNPQECWFCLANPKVTKHLIVSLGNSIYMSMAKGSLVDPFGPTCLVPGGGNLVLVSILHVTSFLSAAPETCAALAGEIAAAKKAITDMYNKHGAAPVFFEAYRPGGQHAHLQVAPVPLALVPQLEEAFTSAGTVAGLELSLETRADPNCAYFQVQLPNGIVLTGLIPKSVRFNLSFGREVLGNLLGTPERIDWRQCEFTLEQEQTIRNTFAEAFKPFSPFTE
ncbi:hypothetical protein DSO57_1034812 [Entomophthora muscae]|uniref:Uncharacterized protein n=1 Tax=Entomophthora muscae TaxID=34485 RepID=A0ACC2SNT3_9FUNG|nr:hypothetical protein DSO57_1034812 [Entomophthora muscae]